MVHCLSAIIAGVHDDAKTIVEFLGLGYSASFLKEFSEQLFVVCTGDIVNVLLGNHKDMGWGLRIYVAESEPIVFFADDLCWNFFVDNFAE